MREGADLLRRVRVASPCPVSWEGMEGDERVRFCRQCSLHVYNIASLTSAEAESLVARTEGRLCARLYRRADGTVLTSDCPVGLAAARRRVARGAGAVLAAVLSLCGGAFGQNKGKRLQSCEPGAVKVTRAAQDEGSAVKGTVFDPAQAVVPGALVRLAAKGSERKYAADTSAEGTFEFTSLPPGTYDVEVSSPGFQTRVVQQLAVGKGEAVRIDLTLGLDPSAMEMGVIVMDDMTTTPRNGHGVYVFGSREITSLPIR